MQRHSRSTLVTGLGLALLAPALFAARQEAGSTRTSLAPTAPEPLAAPAADPLAEAQALAELPREERFGAQELVVGVAELDDSVPLPNPPVWRSSPSGDVLVSPASGDPYFLGFAAGKYYPPADEVLDPALIAALASARDGRPAPETYAFVMLSRRITPERVARLEQLGARVLGTHPHHTLKVAVDEQAALAIAGDGEVRWIGVERTWQKRRPDLANFLRDAEPGQRVPVYIDVFESDLCAETSARVVGHGSRLTPDGPQAADPAAEPQNAVLEWMSNGWMQRALEARGVEVRSYDRNTNTFRAWMPSGVLAALLELDFVQYVEPERTPVTLHDESCAMIGTDLGRATYDGGTNDAAVTGVIDTGFDYTHVDFTGLYGWGWDCTATSGGPWIDSNGHGSHVASSMLGDGTAELDQQGNAPGLARSTQDRPLYIVQMLNGTQTCSWSLATVMATMVVPPVPTMEMPHVVNNSWGIPRENGNPAWIGTEYEARLMDDHVFDNDQVLVFAVGNEGPFTSTQSLESSAKNVISVGNVLDTVESGHGVPGALETTSSHGPTGDGRFKPNVAAPGRWVRAADSGTGNGYVAKSGTSMAAPHVTGTIAQLVDQYAYLRGKPHALASLLMATAQPYQNSPVTTNAGNPDITRHGAGRIEAYNAAHDTAQHVVLVNASFDALVGQNYASTFDVPAGTARLVAVMHYTEPAASAGASTALINDWDLYLDEFPFTAGATGEWSSHQSTLDNTEIRTIDNPFVGQWRWKAFPTSVTSDCKMSVSVYAILGSTTTTLSPAVQFSTAYVKPSTDLVIDVTVDTPYFASATYAEISSAANLTIQAASSTLGDGVVTDLLDNFTGGSTITLGNLQGGTSRQMSWTVNVLDEGVHVLDIVFDAENATAPALGSGPIVVDGTPPTDPGNLHSTTHIPGVWSNVNQVQMAWDPSTDALAGLWGYSSLTTATSAEPDDFANLPAGATSANVTLSSNASGRYFKLKALDNAGNASATVSEGPFLIDTVAPSAVQNLIFTSHVVGQPSCENWVTYQWDAAADQHSGVAGYSIFFSETPGEEPNDVVNTSQTVGAIDLFLDGDWYLMVRAIDEAGNMGPVTTTGPISLISSSTTSYCTAASNSVGFGALMGHSGSTSVSANDLVLTCSGMPATTPCVFFYGPNQSQTVFGNGFKCVSGTIVRFAPTSASGGVATFPVDLGNLPGGAQIQVGETWNFQNWYRDPQGGGAFYNMSDALSVTFCN